jgi:hypothetical protein
VKPQRRLPWWNQIPNDQFSGGAIFLQPAARNADLFRTSARKKISIGIKCFMNAVKV